jgi:hypothetical protein
MLTRPDRSQWWSVTREWQGETAFVIGGGPSVLSQDLEQLRGRRVVAINSSYQRVPFADMLFFGDLRWWNKHRDRLIDFPGRIVTCRLAPGGLKGAKRQVLELERQSPPGLATLPTRLTFKRTSYGATLNLLAHLGVAEIVTLGLDGKPDENGATHHHAPHPWPAKPGCWKQQAAELKTLVEPLARAGVTVRNASPGSAIPFWPIVALEDVL